MLEKSTNQPKMKALKILPEHHTWLMHEKAATGKTLYEIIGEFVETEAERRAQAPAREGEA